MEKYHVYPPSFYYFFSACLGRAGFFSLLFLSFFEGLVL